MAGTSTISILKNFPKEATRILKLSKKPTRAEFEDVTKITGIGIVLLGAIGLAFLLIRAFLEGKFT
jgi:protein transport protein SEC61 subunit gamma-like protein